MPNSNFKSQHFICLDCETTGLDVLYDEIIEFAAVKFSQEKGIIEKMSFFINSGKLISEESEKIHNITNEMIKDAQSFDKHVDQIKKFIGDLPIVGHMISFDISILENSAKRHGKILKFKKNLIIDTLRLSKRYYNSSSNSLTGLCEFLGIKEREAHRALNDVLMTVDLFEKLSQGFSSLKDLENLINKPIKILYMPFGKHRGEKVSSLSNHYLMHLSKCKTLDLDIKYTINQILKQRKCSIKYQSPLSDLL